MSCAGESCAGDHDHSHHAHGGAGEAGHSHDDPERGVEEGLFEVVDFPKVAPQTNYIVRFAANIMNKQVAKFCGHGLTAELEAMFGAWLESDADAQLLLFIPFTADVKLKSITVWGEEGAEAPTHLKVFKNRDDIDFDMAESITPVQEWDLIPGNGTYETRIAHFQGVRDITLFFSDNAGADSTKIFYIALSGEFKKVFRRSVITVAEVAADPKDHKLKSASDAGLPTQNRFIN